MEQVGFSGNKSIMMGRLDKIIIYSLFFTPAIVIVAYFLWSILFGESPNELIRERALKEAFAGRVDSIFLDNRNHNTRTLILSSGYKYGIYPVWEKYIETGDSLFKQKESMLLLVRKADGSEIRLDFKDTYRK